MTEQIQAEDREQPVQVSEIHQLISLVTSPEVMAAGLAERRRILIDRLAEFLQADRGIWSWGRGFSAEGGIQPVAMIDFGMEKEHLICLAELGLDPRNDLEFRGPIIQRMGDSRQITIVRRDLHSDEEWENRPFFRLICEGLGMDSWITSIRYPGPDTWMNVTYWRKAGRPEMGARERQLLDLITGSIAWVLPTAVETVPAEVFAGLTHRQRTVLLLLLEGYSRKSIAAQLGVTEHTIGDHIKLIYQHFRVHSVSELAARMLKSN